DQREFAVDDQQHAFQLVAAAQNLSAGRNHAVRALLARQPRVFLDTIERHFRRAAENRKHRPVLQKIDGVVAPFTISDHAPVKVEDAIQFETVERYILGREWRGAAALLPPGLAWVCIA